MRCEESYLCFMAVAPLAERMRPRKLSEFIGQEHLVGPKGTLSKAVKAGVIPSMIFWGPPGVGKTTLAYLLASELQRPFFMLSAINSGVKDVREVIEKAQGEAHEGSSPILFIDE